MDVPTALRLVFYLHLSLTALVILLSLYNQISSVLISGMICIWNTVRNAGMSPVPGIQGSTHTSPKESFLESSWTLYTANFSIGLCVALFFILVHMRDYLILSVISNIFKYSLLKILKERREKCPASHLKRKLLMVSGHKDFYFNNWFSCFWKNKSAACLTDTWWLL